VIFHDGRSETDPQPDSLLKEWEGKLDSHSYSLFPHVAKAFGCDKSFFLILRPDNYIGMISDDLSTERVREYLTLVSR
jgi:hypothetical protein